MTHLVRPIVTQAGKLGPEVAAYASQLRDAHSYLVKLGSEVLRGDALEPDPSSWGRTMKRKTIIIVDPPDIIEARGAHNLVEVINQCATMERLLDAFTWILAQPDLRGLRVSRCHPTTSSRQDDEDNDLVLVDANGVTRARFEVSDVVGARDGNRKEAHDLKSLLRKTALADSAQMEAGDCRLFLVVSASFAGLITNTGRRVRSTHRYHQVIPQGDLTANFLETAIIEVLPGQA